MATLHPKRTALVVIDPQNWTLGMPIAPYTAKQIVGNSLTLAKSLRTAGGLVCFTRAAFSPGYADMVRVPVDIGLSVPDGGIPAEALAFSEEMESFGADLMITKRQWSAFHGTELDLQLRRRGIESVIIAGVMTNFGVESSVRDAWQYNYAPVVAEDACSSLTLDMHRFAIEKILPRVARVRLTIEITNTLSCNGEL